MDNIQMDSQQQSNNTSDSKKIIIPLVVAVAVLVAGYFVYQSGYGGPKAEVAGKTEVTQSDLSPTSTSRVPKGFPVSIPVEDQNIKESYKINYFDEGVVQYTVAFNSMLTKDELWKLYSDFFLTAGYAPDETAIDEVKGVLRGWRSGNKLNIAIGPYDGGSYVTINYIERQVSVAQ